MEMWIPLSLGPQSSDPWPSPLFQLLSCIENKKNGNPKEKGKKTTNSGGVEIVGISTTGVVVTCDDGEASGGGWYSKWNYWQILTRGSKQKTERGQCLLPLSTCLTALALLKTVLDTLHRNFYLCKMHFFFLKEFWPRWAQKLIFNLYNLYNW